MNKKTVSACVCGLLLVGLAAIADDATDLMALDKEWGEAAAPEAIESLIADDIIAIGTEGLGGKAEVLQDVAAAESSGPYTAGDYKTQFLSDDVAIMVHTTSGDEPHWSLHVWQRVGGKWQVAATASVPIEE